MLHRNKIVVILKKKSSSLDAEYGETYYEATSKYIIIGVKNNRYSFTEFWELKMGNEQYILPTKLTKDKQ